LKKFVADKKTRSSVFQVLLLNNDSGEDVEVQEAKQVNFLQVKKHLRNGGSVFITSKPSQKIVHTKPRHKRSFSNQEKNYEALSRKRLRSP